MGLAVALCGALLFVLALRVDRRWIDVHMTPHYCAETSRQLLRGTVLRWTGIAVGAVLVVLSPLAARWGGRRTASEIAGAVLRLVLAAALALVVSDAVLRWKGYRDPARPPVFHYEPDSEPDPLLVFRPIASRVTESVAGGRHLRFVIDSHGWRVRSTEDSIDFAKPTVLFAGESIASGFGLNYEETYVYGVGQDLGVQVVNLAVQGYGNDGAYVRLMDALPRFQQPIATVTLVNQTMLERNVWPDRPHLVVADDLSRSVEPVRVDDGWLGRSPLLHFTARLVHSDEGLRRARAYIASTARETRERGGFPLFVLTNFDGICLPDATGAPSIEHILFDGLDVVHVRVDLGDAEYDPVIAHPNALAQKLLGAAITRSLREHGIVAH